MSAFKYVPIPAPITQNGIPVTAYAIVRVLLAEDTRANSSRKGMFAAERIETEFAAKQAPGDFARLHPDDHALLDEICAAPTCGYPVLTGTDANGQAVRIPMTRATLLPTLSAIEKATDEPLVTETKEPEAKAAE